MPQEELQKVFEFVQSLQTNSLFRQWDNISDTEAKALQIEFAQEDIDFSECVLSDHLVRLNEMEED